MINCKTKTRKELIEAIKEACDILYRMTDDGPCDYDNQGLCQTHGSWRPCSNERALEFLELWSEHGK